jgi:hypothetical protein
MPAFLLSATFWKVAGATLMALALSIAIGSAVHHYRDIKAQAALVPGLQSANEKLAAESAHNDRRAGKAAADLDKAYAQIKQANADLARWHDWAAGINHLARDRQQCERHKKSCLSSY